MSKTPTLPIHGYLREAFEQSIDNASFLWLLRETALLQPHYLPSELTELEGRIQNNLNALHTTSTDDAWDVCKTALQWRQAGEVFTAAIFAFRSLEVKRIQYVVEVAFTNDDTLKGLISALAWLPEKFVISWLEKFIKSKDINHKYLAMSVFSARRLDPGSYLSELLQRDDCLMHSNLHSRALRLIGELKLTAYISALDSAVNSNDKRVAFWARWSALMLGDKSMIDVLEPTVIEVNPFQHSAIDLVMRSVTPEQGRPLISALFANKDAIRATVKACAVLGDPEVVPWLIQVMENMAYARVAGDAFTHITGIYLEENDLAIDVPDIASIIPNDDPHNDNVSLDPDENLPWPNVGKLKVVWQQYGNQYSNGRRYFLGKNITADILQQQLQHGYQTHRHSAALELAIMNSEQIMPNIKARLSE